MCGILGQVSRNIDRREFKSRLGLLHHRGPDDSGIYFDENIALGHTRLSILDLSSDGHQPMISNCENFIINFNGEIYNFEEIKKDLIQKGYVFNSQADTEVLLYGYIEYKENIVNKLNGMFVFSIYDKKEAKLFLARDRSGMKPLYYFKDDKIFSFSSELSAITKHSSSISLDAKILFLLLGFVPEPFNIYENISMFPAGHYGYYKDNKLKTIKYDEYKYEPKIVKPYAEIVSDTRELLVASIKRHLISDAPVGVFLSGGVDSSVITSIASQCKSDLQTLSLVFKEKSLNEEYFQDLIVDKYSTNHIKCSIDKNIFLSTVDDFMSLMEKPTIDGLNTYFISKAAKDSNLKSVLSGIGGDEIFYGYPSFKNAKILKLLSKIPYSLIKIFENFSKIKRGTYRKLELVKAESELAYYLPNRGLFSPSEISDILKVRKDRVYHLITNLYNDYHPSNIYQVEDKISFYELNMYMKNQLLRDSDLFGMANSVEIRTPFLDRELINYVLKVKPKEKFGKHNKNLLVDATANLLPKEIFSRRKSGFVLPYERWLMDDIDKLNVGKNIINKFKARKISWSQLWAIYILKSKFNEKL
jgi:asparagine synthase (glutamine-hydrolysing)